MAEPNLLDLMHWLDPEGSLCWCSCPQPSTPTCGRTGVCLDPHGFDSRLCSDFCDFYFNLSKYFALTFATFGATTATQ